MNVHPGETLALSPFLISLLRYADMPVSREIGNLGYRDLARNRMIPRLARDSLTSIASMKATANLSDASFPPLNQCCLEMPSLET